MTAPPHSKPILLIALGGNSMVRKGQAGTMEEQFENLKLPADQIARLTQDYRIIITHGNGPQVGNLMRQQESCEAMDRLPLEILVAQTQGQIGYMLESTIDQSLMALGINDRPLVSLISYVVVDETDPAFDAPTKPVGPVFTASQAEALPYPVVATRGGFRRVVVSPRPVTIVEKREIRQLMEMDFIVICCGGGGIPVIREGRAFQGVDAVIDKDLASARLAEEIGVDIFIIATDVPGVALGFGTPRQRFLSTLSVDDAARHLLAGDFAAGSMGPKVEAAMQVVSNRGRRAVITAVDRIEAAVKGEAGTEFSQE